MIFGDYEYEVKYGLAVITSYKGNESRVEIPEKMDKYPVYTLGTNSFSELLDLEEVIIPSSVGKLEDDVFVGCHRLQTIRMGVIEKVGNFCTDNAKHLPIEVFASSTTASKVSKLKGNFIVYSDKDFKYYVTNEAKKECVITKIKVFNNFLEIPDEIDGYKVTQFTSTCIAISKKRNLVRVKLPKYLKEVPDFFFSHCKKLEEVESFDYLESIGRGAFEECPNLESFKFSKSLKEIGPFAFYNFKSYKSKGY